LLIELTNRIAIVLEFIGMMMMMMMIIIIIVNKIIADRKNKSRLYQKYDRTVDNRPYYDCMPSTGIITLHKEINQSRYRPGVAQSVPRS